MAQRPKTAAERQAAYRANRSTAGENGDGERRITAWVATSAYLALARLSRHHGETNRQTLERLITAADEKITKKLDFDSSEWDAYFKPRRKAKRTVTA